MFPSLKTEGELRLFTFLGSIDPESPVFVVLVVVGVIVDVVKNTIFLRLPLVPDSSLFLRKKIPRSSQSSFPPFFLVSTDQRNPASLVPFSPFFHFLSHSLLSFFPLFDSHSFSFSLFFLFSKFGSYQPRETFSFSAALLHSWLFSLDLVHAMRLPSQLRHRRRRHHRLHHYRHHHHHHRRHLDLFAFFFIIRRHAADFEIWESTSLFYDSSCWNASLPACKCACLQVCLPASLSACKCACLQVCRRPGMKSFVRWSLRQSPEALLTFRWSQL